MSEIYGSLPDFSNAADDVPVVEDAFVKETSPRDLRNYASKIHHRVTALQHMQCLCRDNSMSLSSNVCAVQDLTMDVLAAFRSHHDGGESLVELRRACDGSKAKLTASLKASNKKLSNAQLSLQAFKRTDDTDDNLATHVSEAEKALNTSQEK